jgi:hypothetical protein
MTTMYFVWIAASILLLIVAVRLYLLVSDQHIHFHSQRLDYRNIKQPIWRYARCWWFFSPNDQSKSSRSRHPWTQFGLSWSFFIPCITHIGFDIAGEEDDFRFYAGIAWLFSFHMILQGLPFFDALFRDVRDGYGYETSISWSDGTLRIHVAYDETWGARTFDRWWIPNWIHVWTSSSYKEHGGVGFYVSFLLDNLFLGSMQHEKVYIWEKPVIAEMPIEPDNSLGLHYTASFMAERHTWWRKHFPMFKRVHHYVDIRLEDPPMHQGKGENSYDLDDDGIFGMGMPGTTIEEAIAGYQAAVKSDRDRYGMGSAMHNAIQTIETRLAWKTLMSRPLEQESGGVIDLPLPPAVDS